jgi:hypothetical protein
VRRGHDAIGRQVRLVPDQQSEQDDVQSFRILHGRQRLVLDIHLVHVGGGPAPGTVVTCLSALSSSRHFMPHSALVCPQCALVPRSWPHRPELAALLRVWLSFLAG